MTFPVPALSSRASAAVSLAWVVLPSLLLVTGAGFVLGWLVLREEALPAYTVEPGATWWLDR